ncbi:Putative glycoside hydrolase family 10 domain, glycoside hydrolase superfamily [Septoria linicola]|uniref:Beta-xylanase n=1 Tax=Septoria linicola TaxID=215465 RepID=A0A9Q9B4L6_9PEZI|nr:putative glycoside hydrolase family 10 domain, glycoside hydrolase superfamily [Septoria linicola]USW58150.1 Putative glycoside hydrolase family 10 domain, glycoside hydrolase superfamily [Septoria linicola]
MHIQDLCIATLAFAGAALAEPEAANGYGSKAKTGLWTAMRDRGRKFIGTALTIRDDPSETAIISNKADFNSITPENAQKWDVIEPARNQFNFTLADQHIDYATERGYQTHCHNLVWHSQLAPWVEAGNFDNATLIEVMRNHINKVAGRYKGRCTRWDVVNEALNENGTYRDSVWYKTIGEAYIPLAFAMARKADPKAQLFYNDYNLEYNGDKTAGALRIVKLIQQYGGKIHGVGLQAHLTSEGTPTSGGGVTPDQATLETVLRGFTSLNVDVVYTELDVRYVTPGTPAKVEAQKAAYQRIAASCLAVKRCIGITLWGVSDKYSWIPQTFKGEGDALLWDANYKKKPVYDSFLKGIKTGGKKSRSVETEDEQ